jgi:starvation-inducible outer membrane lipoprotein
MKWPLLNRLAFLVEGFLEPARFWVGRMFTLIKESQRGLQRTMGESCYVFYGVFA